MKQSVRNYQHHFTFDWVRLMMNKWLIPDCVPFFHQLLNSQNFKYTSPGENDYPSFSHSHCLFVGLILKLQALTASNNWGNRRSSASPVRSQVITWLLFGTVLSRALRTRWDPLETVVSQFSNYYILVLLPEPSCLWQAAQRKVLRKIVRSQNYIFHWLY